MRTTRRLLPTLAILLLLTLGVGAVPAAEQTAHYDNFCRLVIHFKKWLRCHPSPSSCAMASSNSSA